MLLIYLISGRFWRMRRELVVYCTVKLKIFFGIHCDTNHTFVDWEREYFVTLLKKDPWQVSWLFSLFSSVLEKLLSGTINVVLNILAMSILVNFQSSFIALFGDIFRALENLTDICVYIYIYIHIHIRI